MKFPADYTTSEGKYQFICRAKEEARQLYNLVSKWADKGIKQTDYDSLPASVKKAFSFTNKLSQDDWQKFFGKFKVLSNEIAEELCTQRARVEDKYSALPIEVDLGEVSDAF